MDFRNEYASLEDCLNKVETNLLDISNAITTPGSDEKVFSSDFLKRVKEGIGIVRLIRSQCDLYYLEQWKERKKGVDYLVPHYVIIDKKGVERFRVAARYFSYESIWITEICNSYDCKKTALQSDLVSRDINKNNLFIKEGDGWIKGFICEDETEAFLITYGSIYATNFQEMLSGREIVSLRFISDNTIEMYCTYDKRHGYLKGAEYTAKVEIKIPEWEIISDVVTNREDYNLK